MYLVIASLGIENGVTIKLNDGRNKPNNNAIKLNDDRNKLNNGHIL